MSEQPVIDFERLKVDIEEFSKIGLRPEEQGLFRMAFTADEEAARNWLIHKAKEAGFSVAIDGARNISIRLGENGGTAVATGSHIDSVPAGGHLDGALGVLTGLECIRRLKELNIALKRPVELIAFSDEEGRFGSMLGSKAICGQHKLEDLENASNIDGESLEEKLRDCGSSIHQVMESKRDREDFHSFVELHIEQGPVLDQKKVQIGVVTDIVGLFRWRANLKGEANHAGTTPMHLRRDAFAGLAEFASKIDGVLGKFGSSHSRATIGKVETLPGALGVVPEQVNFSFDVRDPDGQRLAKLQFEFEKLLKIVAERRKLEHKVETIGELTPVQCDQSVLNKVKTSAESFNLSYIELPSGAAHDCQTMASITNVGMIFIPSSNGVSHSPREHSEWHDIENGANVLLNTLIQLGQESN